MTKWIWCGDIHRGARRGRGREGEIFSRVRTADMNVEVEQRGERIDRIFGQWRAIKIDLTHSLPSPLYSHLFILGQKQFAQNI
jgi:hypothetical protein